MTKVLCLDPSGNHGKKEGDGTTGWAVFEDGELKDFGKIESSDFKTQEGYWYAHYELIERVLPDRLVIENYNLFAHKAKQQSGSSMDTPQLIGYLRMSCWEWTIPITWQRPSDKVRVNDEILVHQGVFELRGGKHYCLDRPTVIHERDAIRHGIFFHKYGRGKK